MQNIHVDYFVPRLFIAVWWNRTRCADNYFVSLLFDSIFSKRQNLQLVHWWRQWRRLFLWQQGVETVPAAGRLDHRPRLYGLDHQSAPTTTLSRTQTIDNVVSDITGLSCKQTVGQSQLGILGSWAIVSSRRNWPTLSFVWRPLF